MANPDWTDPEDFMGPRDEVVALLKRAADIANAQRGIAWDELSIQIEDAIESAEDLA